ncbi:hypothetical protein SO694_00079192 [Aureococcus anophagefferens]|uniref:TNFR-Cys domain-containing protein n=1 Tax=Aureococcus anophagefferens TaxID=44056 RepID=A0ABR1FH06_AURAN
MASIASLAPDGWLERKELSDGVSDDGLSDDESLLEERDTLETIRDSLTATNPDEIDGLLGRPSLGSDGLPSPRTPSRRREFLGERKGSKTRLSPTPPAAVPAPTCAPASTKNLWRGFALFAMAMACAALSLQRSPELVEYGPSRRLQTSFGERVDEAADGATSRRLQNSNQFCAARDGWEAFVGTARAGEAFGGEVCLLASTSTESSTLYGSHAAYSPPMRVRAEFLAADDLTRQLGLVFGVPAWPDAANLPATGYACVLEHKVTRWSSKSRLVLRRANADYDKNPDWINFKRSRWFDSEPNAWYEATAAIDDTSAAIAGKVGADVSCEVRDDGGAVVASVRKEDRWVMAHPGKVGFYSERDDLGERFVRALEVDGERAPEEPSFCCYWSPTSDMCGDCPDPQTDGWCAASRARCEGCGGTFCDAPTPPKEQGCACEEGPYEYDGKTFEGCTSYGWSVPWCGTTNCGICDGLVSTGCWDECEETYAPSSSEPSPKPTTSTPSAAPQGFPAIPLPTSATSPPTPTVFLTNADFRYGTYLITNPGVYVLREDIVFAPETPKMMPPLDSETYPPDRGFWLGFFAAISVAADDVVVDLNGHEIRSSREFLLRQRFFSIIELADKPFKANSGPPQFGALDAPLVPARRVHVKSGTLGLSSHMGIHGNDNEDVTVTDVVIRDFETGGVQLNGASRVRLERVTVGPSLGHEHSAGPVPALATLSQATNLLRVAEGTRHERQEEMVLLSAAVERFVQETLAGEDTSASVFASEAAGYAGLPDGSAIYGVLFHKTNVAIHEFAACSAADVEDHENDPLDGVELIDVEIKELKLAAEEIVAVKVDGRDVTGPAGDVLQIFKAADAEGYYAPNALIEAQFAMRGLHEVAAAAGAADDVLFNAFGSLHIPKRLAVDWRRGDVTLAEAFALMEADGARVAFRCSKDSMGHHNKGVVGLRLEFVTDVSLRGLKIRDLENVGLTSQFFDGVCEDDPLDHHRTYKGSDVRGVTMSYVGGVSSAQAKIGNLRSPAGAAVGAELRTNVLTTKLADVAYGDIQGADFDRSHHLVVHDAANPEVSVVQRRLRDGDGCPFARAFADADRSGCPFAS